MTYIEIDGVRYPAVRITGTTSDSSWDRRESRSILLNMNYETAIGLFSDNIRWSIVTSLTTKTAKADSHGRPILDERGQVIYEDSETTEVFDCSDFCVAGPLTDNRDGTVLAKMGKMTELEEAYEILLGGGVTQ